MEDLILDIAMKVISSLAIAYFLGKAFFLTWDLFVDIRNEFRKNVDDEND